MSNGQVKIMDLGLALPRDAKRVTTAGMIIGTPAYLSPEQAQGLPLDTRTDIYSLGIVLYEMATGQLPFLSDDIPALLMQHVKQPPAPPRLLNAEIPVALENVILKALDYAAAQGAQIVNMSFAGPKDAVIERGIARDDYKVLDDSGKQIGYVTSGSYAPFLKKNIALAYVPPQFAEVGSTVNVEIRGQGVKAKVVPTPFYKRPRKTT